MIDGTTDPLSWLDYCKSFRGQDTPNDMEIGYTIFHLIDTTQLRYMHLTWIKPVMGMEHAGHCITEYFG